MTETASITARELANAQPRTFMRLDVDGKVDDWHVNRHFMLGHGRHDHLIDFLPIQEFHGMHGVILQLADATAHWLITVVNEDDDTYTVEKAAFAGLDGMPVPIDCVTVLATSEALEALDD